MKDNPPKHFTKFMQEYPEVGKAYSILGDSVHHAGPLNEKTRSLIKIAISGGAKMQGAFHAHVRKARLVGVSFDEIKHVVMLSLPTLGFPNMMALLSWVEDVEKIEAET
jgi:4-carboxymuconolactone decarboxylase